MGFSNPNADTEGIYEEQNRKIFGYLDIQGNYIVSNEGFFKIQKKYKKFKANRDGFKTKIN